MAQKRKNDTKKQAYIEVIDDTRTEGQNSRRINKAASIYLVVCLCCIPTMLIGVLLRSLVAAAATLTLTAMVAFFILSYRSQKTQVLEERPSESFKRPISKSKLDELRSILKRLGGSITMTSCTGSVVPASEMKKILLLPAYALANNPSTRQYNFVRVSRNCDVSIISQRDRDIILEAFGYDEDEPIWFCEKDIAKWTKLSTIRVINFVDKDGKKWCFGHSAYSNFFGLVELCLDNDDNVVVRIKNTGPTMSKYGRPE